MPATVKIMRWTGSSASPTKTDITGTTNRAATADDPDPGTNNPIPVPSSGTNYSFWVATRLSATSAPSTAINNIKWYTDGTNSMGTGVSLNVAMCSTYVQATGTVGTSGNQLTSANYTSALNPSVAVNAFQYTSASPLSVNGSIGSTTGDFGDFVIYQVAVVSTAGPGVTTAEQLTWQYDET
jgi:hypothetical protein